MNVSEEEPSGEAELSGWGERIRSAREKAGLTQQGLADQMGVGLSTVRRYESETTAPDLPSLVRLAELTDESVEWLATGREVGRAETERPAPQQRGAGLNVGVPPHLKDLTRSLEDRDREARKSVAARGMAEEKRELAGALYPGLAIEIPGVGVVMFRLSFYVEGRTEPLVLTANLGNGGGS